MVEVLAAEGSDGTSGSGPAVGERAWRGFARTLRGAIGPPARPCREPRAASGVVRTFDVDATLHEDKQVNYMVMEHVDGKSLRKLLIDLQRRHHS